MAEQLEWYPWYWMRWQRSRRVLSLSLASRGLYRELLDECWRVGSIPDNPKELAGLTFTRVADVRRAWPSVRRFFTKRPDGRLCHEDMIDLRRKQAVKHQRAVLNGSKGGRPKGSRNRDRNLPETQKEPTGNLKKSIRVETTLTTTAAGTPRLRSGASLPTAVASIIPLVVPRSPEQEAEFVAVKEALRA